MKDSLHPNLMILTPTFSFLSDKYQVFDSASRGLLRVEELEDQGQSLANVFILRLLENTDDREVSYMLKAPTQ